MILSYALVALLTVSVKAQEVVIIKGSKDTSDKPLIIVDGVVRKNADMNEMSPNNIQSINVLKGNMATKKYGEQGSKGVIEITSKKKTGEVTVTAKEVKIDTTILDGNNDSIINKNVNLSIVIDGDKITINGKPADKNDPRLKMMGRSSMGKNGNRKKVIIEDITTEEKPEIEERAEIMEQPEAVIRSINNGITNANHLWNQKLIGFFDF